MIPTDLQFSKKNDDAIFNSYKTPVLDVIRNISDDLWGVTIKALQPETYLTVPTTPNSNSVLRMDKKKL